MSRRRSSAVRSRPGRHRDSGGGRSQSTRLAPAERAPFEVTADKLSHDGRGIASHQGKTLFVEGLLPGERASVTLQSVQSRFGEAAVQTLLSTSSERSEPICGHYQRCGGCNLQHLNVERQLTFKQEAVQDQVQRWGRQVPARLLPPITSDHQGYRSRARLSVWYERGGQIALGFREAGSKQLVQIEHCPVLAPSLQAILAPLGQWLHGMQTKRAVTHIELLWAEPTLALVVRHTKPLKAPDLHALRALATATQAQVWLQPEAHGPLYDLRGEACDPRLHYELPEYDLRLAYHPRDFTQVNPQVNQAMVSQALSLLAPSATERVLDLFCGVGNFTLPLARRAGEVIGLEAVEAMVARGRENAEANGIDNVQFRTVDLEADLDRLTGPTGIGAIDAVMLDPPRAGAKGAMALLRQLSAARIVYVSCNPATLARDCQSLGGMGYRLEALGVMDMFPHTAHVESMALFIKGSSRLIVKDSSKKRAR